MRVLVTGGAGFIGSHVIEELQRRGHEPSVCDDLSSGKRDNVPQPVPLIQTDIRDAAALGACFEQFQPQAVCHLAAQVSVSRSVREPLFDAEVNILGLLQVLRAAVRHHVGRVVFSSSGGAVYGEARTPANEELSCRPISPYGISKLTGERYLEHFASEHRLKGIALRYSNVYGPRQDPHGEAGVVAIFSTQMLAGEAVTINGDGKYVRDYVEVSDVARATVAALEADIDGPFNVFNVGTGIGIDVNELAERMRPLASRLRKARGREGFVPEPRHGPPRPGDLRSNMVSHEKISQQLGWKPQVALEEGLRRTIAWFAERT